MHAGKIFILVLLVAYFACLSIVALRIRACVHPDDEPRGWGAVFWVAFFGSGSIAYGGILWLFEWIGTSARMAEALASLLSIPALWLVWLAFTDWPMGRRAIMREEAASLAEDIYKRHRFDSPEEAEKDIGGRPWPSGRSDYEWKIPSYKLIPPFMWRADTVESIARSKALRMIAGRKQPESAGAQRAA